LPTAKQDNLKAAVAWFKSGAKTGKLHKAMMNFPTGLKILEEAGTALEVRCKDAVEEQTLQKAEETANLLLSDPGMRSGRGKTVFGYLTSIKTKCSQQFMTKHQDKISKIQAQLDECASAVSHDALKDNGRVMDAVLEAFMKPLKDLTTGEQATLRVDSQAETLEVPGNSGILDMDARVKELEDEIMLAREALSPPTEYLDSMINPDAELFVSDMKAYQNIVIFGCNLAISCWGGCPSVGFTFV